MDHKAEPVDEQHSTEYGDENNEKHQLHKAKDHNNRKQNVEICQTDP